MDTSESPGFNGPHYDPKADDPRLMRQHERIKRVMLDGAWRTLREIAKLTGDPEASISAQLRHLRKKRFGSWDIRTEPTGNREDGLFRYRLLVPTADQTVEEAPAREAPRFSKSDWRDLADELPRVVAIAASQEHAPSDALKKLVAYVTYRARPRVR